MASSRVAVRYTPPRYSPGCIVRNVSAPPSQPRVLGVIAAGGALGALARYGLAVALPHQPGAFPWATFLTNASGCLLLGA
ncbi:CrcB family protein, partial [Carbonactinospora thermoautotrophica]|uniref:FluC/FEX family fluoride channel n=1 Tax=Carbonactinospora thermoautotrophica TaxID=1469144 RepID=UPI002FCCBE40